MGIPADGAGGSSGDDPFEDLVLDEDFVRSARKVEDAGEARIERAARARSRWEAAQLESPKATRRGRHREGRTVGSNRRRRWTASAPALLVVVALGAAVWLDNGGAGELAVRLSGAPLNQEVGASDPLPTPTRGERVAPASDGGPDAGTAYQFMATQHGSSRPVAYDPCRAITIVVNDRTAPTDAPDLLDEALRAISGATGLRFEVEGPTDEVPIAERAPFQPDRYGDRWAPVLVAWSDADEVEELGARDGDLDVAGIGGSTAYSVPSTDLGEMGELVYVSGLVVLDGPDLADIRAGSADGRALVLSTLLHELGHLVGLDHIDDSDQLMHPVGHPDVTSLRSGDLAGLEVLGRGACVPAL